MRRRRRRTTWRLVQWGSTLWLKQTQARQCFPSGGFDHPEEGSTQNRPLHQGSSCNVDRGGDHPRTDRWRQVGAAQKNKLYNGKEISGLSSVLLSCLGPHFQPACLSLHVEHYPHHH